MALDTTTLRGALTAAFDKVKVFDGETGGQSQQDAINSLAFDMTIAINNFVKSGLVSTTVTGTLPAGPVAAVGTGTIA